MNEHVHASKRPFKTDSHQLRFQPGDRVHFLARVEIESTFIVCYCLVPLFCQKKIGAIVKSQGTGKFSKAALYWSKNNLSASHPKSL